MRDRCIGRARDVRSMWVFGLEGQELFRFASRCRRPKGHRGECLRYPKAALLPPWRSLDLSRYDYPTT